MARSFLLCLAAASYCLLLLLPSPVQGRVLFREPHLDEAAEPPMEQQRGAAVEKQLATPASWSPPAAVMPELRWVPGGLNPLHNHGSTTTTRKDEERTSPAVVAEAAQGSVSVVRPELRATPWGANPLHN